MERGLLSLSLLHVSAKIVKKLTNKKIKKTLDKCAMMCYNVDTIKKGEN